MSESLSRRTAQGRTTEPDASGPGRWAGAWPDALAYAAGLAMAWHFSWRTTDLVWGLWLASLVVGYATILWSIFGPGVLVAGRAWGDRGSLRGEPIGPIAALVALYLVGGLCLLAFFTVHFGGFHFVHSVFLNGFFPVTPGTDESFPDLALYRVVFQRYWIFVLVAAVAERQAFRLAPPDQGAPDTAVTVAAIAARKARNARAGFGRSGLMAPYRNVIRMHLLIFFFACAHFARLDNFAVYAVVYAVYFLPWRLLGKAQGGTPRE